MREFDFYSPLRSLADCVARSCPVGKFVSLTHPQPPPQAGAFVACGSEVVAELGCEGIDFFFSPLGSLADCVAYSCLFFIS